MINPITIFLLSSCNRYYVKMIVIGIIPPDIMLSTECVVTKNIYHIASTAICFPICHPCQMQFLKTLVCKGTYY